MPDSVASLTPSGDVVVAGAVASLLLDLVETAARGGARILPEVAAVVGVLGDAARRYVAPSNLGKPRRDVVARAQIDGCSELIGTTEAAALLSCSPESVRAKAASGAIPAVKVGSAWLIDRRAVEKSR